MSRKRVMVAILAVSVLAVLCAGNVEAKKPPPEPEPEPNPEIVYHRAGRGKKVPSGTWVMNADGSSETYVWRGHWPSWSPDGTQLAVNWHSDGWLLYRVDLDGGNPTYLADHLANRPKWSPATDPIAPSHGLIAYADIALGDLLVVDAAGGTAPEVLLAGTWISDPEYGDWYDSPAWSPDGTMLAAKRLFGDFSHDQIVVVPFDSPEGNYVVFDTTDSVGIVEWARQHNWLAFSGSLGGVYGTYTLDLDDPEAEPQLVVEGMDRPSWSQDDSRLIGQIGDELYIYDFTDGSLENLGEGAFPDWKRCVTQQSGDCVIP